MLLSPQVFFSSCSRSAEAGLYRLRGLTVYTFLHQRCMLLLPTLPRERGFVLSIPNCGVLVLVLGFAHSQSPRQSVDCFSSRDTFSSLEGFGGLLYLQYRASEAPLVGWGERVVVATGASLAGRVSNGWMHACGVNEQKKTNFQRTLGTVCILSSKCLRLFCFGMCRIVDF